MFVVHVLLGYVQIGLTILEQNTTQAGTLMRLKNCPNDSLRKTLGGE
jgi:hypothetical protein